MLDFPSPNAPDKGLKPFAPYDSATQESGLGKFDDTPQEPAIVSIFLLLLKKIKSGAIVPAHFPRSGLAPVVGGLPG